MGVLSRRPRQSARPSSRGRAAPWPREIPSGRAEVQSHRIELLDRDQLGRLAIADQVADLDLQLADAPIDGCHHPAIAQIEVGIVDAGLGSGEVGLGGLDIDPIIGLLLLQVGAIGLDLSRGLLELSLGLIVVVLRRRLARKQAAFAPFLDAVEQ